MKEEWFEAVLNKLSLTDDGPVRAPGCNAPFIRFLILAIYILFA